MRHRGPEADGRDLRAVAGVVQHAHDAGRPFVSRALQTEPLDQLRIGRAAGDGRGPRVRDVRKQRAERDHHLHAELLREVDDHPGERAPAKVRLDPEQQHGVAL